MVKEGFGHEQRFGREKYLHCELSEGLLNLAIRCALGHAQHVVVINLNHWRTVLVQSFANGLSPLLVYHAATTPYNIAHK